MPEELLEDEAMDRYEDLISECNPLVKIGGLVFNPGRVVRELDLVAFRYGMLDWTDAEGIEIVE